MLAAAVVPSAPLLVPALAGGAAREVAALLSAAESAVAALLAEEPQLIVCVGPGLRDSRHPANAWGTLAGYGVAVEAPPGPHAEPPQLPLSLTLARWLLDRSSWSGPVLFQEVAADAHSATCAQLGQLLADEAGPNSAWLVIGDDSFRRGERAPGYTDSRAAGFDAHVTAAFAAGDVQALAELDVELADELGAAGRVSWQVLAGALNGAELRATQIWYDAAPFGVGYLVASWWPTR